MIDYCYCWQILLHGQSSSFGKNILQRRNTKGADTANSGIKNVIKSRHTYKKFLAKVLII